MIELGPIILSFIWTFSHYTRSYYFPLYGICSSYQRRSIIRNLSCCNKIKPTFGIFKIILLKQRLLILISTSTFFSLRFKREIFGYTQVYSRFWLQISNEKSLVHRLWQVVTRTLPSCWGAICGVQRPWLAVAAEHTLSINSNHASYSFAKLYVSRHLSEGALVGTVRNLTTRFSSKL